jgi:hypothetical protein
MSSMITTDVKSKKRSSAVSQKRNYENQLLQHQVMTFCTTMLNSGPRQFLTGTSSSARGRIRNNIRFEIRKFVIAELLSTYTYTITVRIKYSIRYEYLIRKQTKYWPFENHFEFESNPTPKQCTKASHICMTP